MATSAGGTGSLCPGAAGAQSAPVRRSTAAARRARRQRAEARQRLKLVRDGARLAGYGGILPPRSSQTHPPQRIVSDEVHGRNILRLYARASAMQLGRDCVVSASPEKLDLAAVREHVIAPNPSWLQQSDAFTLGFRTCDFVGAWSFADGSYCGEFHAHFDVSAFLVALSAAEVVPMPGVSQFCIGNMQCVSILSSDATITVFAFGQPQRSLQEISGVDPADVLGYTDSFDLDVTIKFPEVLMPTEAEIATVDRSAEHFYIGDVADEQPGIRSQPGLDSPECESPETRKMPRVSSSDLESELTSACEPCGSALELLDPSVCKCGACGRPFRKNFMHVLTPAAFDAAMIKYSCNKKLVKKFARRIHAGKFRGSTRLAKGAQTGLDEGHAESDCWTELPASIEPPFKCIGDESPDVEEPPGLSDGPLPGDVLRGRRT